MICLCGLWRHYPLWDALSPALVSCRSHDCLTASVWGYYGIEHAAALPGRCILAAVHEVRAKDSTDSTKKEMCTMCVFNGVLLSVLRSLDVSVLCVVDFNITSY